MSEPEQDPNAPEYRDAECGDFRDATPTEQYELDQLDTEYREVD